MPDHVHVLTPTRDAVEDRRSLARLLGAFSRNVARAGWRVPSPEPVRSPEHGRRAVRYILLNPCRARLADDPLAWPWSTHRGLVGAEVDPWVSADRLASALGRPAAGFARAFHAYVSGDPSVTPHGSAFPVPAMRRENPEQALSTIVASARGATPWSCAAVFRRAAVLLAAHQGWTDTGVIATAIGASSSTARRLATRSDPAALAAAALCLGDERLRELSRAA